MFRSELRKFRNRPPTVRSIRVMHVIEMRHDEERTPAPLRVFHCRNDVRDDVLSALPVRPSGTETNVLKVSLQSLHEPYHVAVDRERGVVPSVDPVARGSVCSLSTVSGYPPFHCMLLGLRPLNMLGMLSAVVDDCEYARVNSHASLESSSIYGDVFLCVAVRAQMVRAKRVNDEQKHVECASFVSRGADHRRLPARARPGRGRILPITVVVDSVVRNLATHRRTARVKCRTVAPAEQRRDAIAVDIGETLQTSQPPMASPVPRSHCGTGSGPQLEKREAGGDRGDAGIRPASESRAWCVQLSARTISFESLRASRQTRPSATKNNASANGAERIPSFTPNSVKMGTKTSPAAGSATNSAYRSNRERGRGKPQSGRASHRPLRTPDAQSTTR